jgi:hypothetical protein
MDNSASGHKSPDMAAPMGVKVDVNDSYDVSWSESYGSSHDPFLEMD